MVAVGVGVDGMDVWVGGSGVRVGANVLVGLGPRVGVKVIVGVGVKVGGTSGSKVSDRMWSTTRETVLLSLEAKISCRPTTWKYDKGVFDRTVISSLISSSDLNTDNSTSSALLISANSCSIILLIIRFSWALETSVMPTIVNGINKSAVRMPVIIRLLGNLLFSR